MGKTNGNKRYLDEERATAGYHPVYPLLYTPHPYFSWSAPVLTLPGKPPHRICRGKP